MEGEVRYCTTEDGVRIAYTVTGEGPPLLLAPYILDSFSLEGLVPEYKTFNDALSYGRRVIRFDVRGTGLSQRHAEDVSHSALVRDVEAVIAASEVGRVSVWAPTASGPTAIAFTARHPKLVSRLVLCGTYPALSQVWTREFVTSFTEMARVNWDPAVRTLADLSGREEFPEGSLQLGRMVSESVSGEMFARLCLTSYETSDVRDLLPQISVPTLVLHRMGDAGVPLALAQAMAAEMPGARLVTLDGRANFPPLGDTQSVIEAVDSFLGEDAATRRTAPVEPQQAQGPLRVVFFTDLVGHTEMMSRLGDERGREVLREHERLTRNTLAAHGGTEVKTMGDGFMASFGSVTKAVECAIALEHAFAERNASAAEPLHVRVGINAGEPIEEEGDLFGATVILASRIAAKAEGGEILVADTVRGLCSGKGLLFADRGEFVAKGFEEPVRVYEVSSRE